MNTMSPMTRHVGTVSIAPLSREEETEMITRWQRDGDQEARETMCRANLRFVMDTVKKMQPPSDAFEELVSYGNEGMLVALDRFDVTRGMKFISYAVWWIRQSIFARIAENERVVRRPGTARADRRLLLAAEIALAGHLEREPTRDEIAAESGLTEERLDTALSLDGTDASLDAPMYAETDKTWLDTVGVEDDPADGIDARLQTEQIEQMLSILDSRKRRVLIYYHGLYGAPRQTLEQIGAMFGVTRERARQLSEQALDEIRQHAGVKKPAKARRVGPKSVKSAAATYQTNRQAAAALGIHITSFERRCRVLGIETPAARKRALSPKES